MEPEFVLHDLRFRARVIDLRRRVFGGSRSFNEAYFNWKYEQNPYLKDPLFSIALDDDRVVGMRGFYGARWVADDAATSTFIPAGADTAVDPDYRGRWLMQRMLRSARDEFAGRGYEFAFNFSANQAMRMLSLRAGWRRLAPYDDAQLTRQTRRGARAWVARTGQRLRRRLNLRSPEFASLDRLGSPLAGDVTVAREVRPDAMADLVAHRRRPQIGHVRDAAFYAWRFHDPRFAYRFLFIGSETELEGFFVLQQARGGGVVSVVDWCAKSAAVRSHLLRALVATTIGRIQIWAATLPHDFLGELHAAGFREGGHVDSAKRPLPGMLIGATGTAAPESWQLGGQALLETEHWELRMIYSDAY